MNLNEKQEKIIETLTSAGYEARWWGRGDEAERIYLNGYRRDVKVWVEFDDPAALEGAALRVWIRPCGQHRNWYVGQSKKAREYFANAFAIITGMAETEKRPDAITEEAAEALQVGQAVNWVVGGLPSDANEERKINGTVRQVRRVPSANIGQTEQVEVVILGEDGDEWILYTWRGVLRCGSGAEVVRQA